MVVCIMDTVIGLVYVPETGDSFDEENITKHYCKQNVYQAEWFNVNEANVKERFRHDQFMNSKHVNVARQAFSVYQVLLSDLLMIRLIYMAVTLILDRKTSL